MPKTKKTTIEDLTGMAQNKKAVIADHKRRIEKLEAELKDLKELLLIKK